MNLLRKPKPLLSIHLQLARRIFYSFAKPGSTYLLETDMVRLFRPEEVSRVFALFDRDGNGDASREEVEMACL